MEELSHYHNLDLSRAYAAGMSNGSGLVNLLAKRTTYFNAVVPMFSQQKLTIADMTAQTPVAVMQIVGENDTTIPAAGGNTFAGEFLNAQDSVLNWVDQFNCSVNDAFTTEVWGSTAVEKLIHTNCALGVEIHHVVAKDTGHGFNWRRDEHIFQEIWKFLSRF